MPQLAPLRVLEIRRATFLQIADINVAAQMFKTHLYLELGIKDGASDARLAEKENKMTNDKESKWPVVPSALWYIENQLTFSNSIQHEVLECKVLKQGNDLVLIKRVRGEFSCAMDLHAFPCDFQSLSVKFEVQCAANGPFPAAVIKAEGMTASIIKHNFMPVNMWDLGSLEVAVTETFLDLGPQSKTYPSAEVTTNVARKWKFYVINIALPIMSFSLLSILLPLCLPQADGASRLGVTLSLVITAAGA